jgi:hypothetical protein
MNDLLDYLTAMREEIDKAIIATSQGDDEGSISHADKVFGLYKELNEFYVNKIKGDLNEYLRNAKGR